MFQYIRKYLISLLLVVFILFLSFFRPPDISNEQLFFPNFDKLVHMCMYAALGSVLWLEYLLKHRHNLFSLKRVFLGAGLLPALLGGFIELLQSALTSYRGGDWMDFAANVAGVALAWLVGYYGLRPRLMD